MKSSKILERLQKAADQYYNTDTPIMTDEEYDALSDQLRSLHPNHEFFKIVGAKVRSADFTKEKHLYPMGSLLKVHTLEEIEEWSTKFVKTKILVTHKLDGSSVELIYKNGKFDKAITRGDGLEGDIITTNVLKMKGVPLEIPIKDTVSVRGEIVLHISDWREYFPEAESAGKNPRNSAAGVVRRLDGQRCEYLRVYAFSINGTSIPTRHQQILELGQFGFLTPQFYLVNDAKSAFDLLNSYTNHLRSMLNYEIDGLVLEENDIQIANDFGEVDMRPRSSRALKFESQTGVTELIDVIWQTARTGQVTPVAIVKPVNIGGVTISRMNLVNMDEIRRLDIKIGDTVSVIRCNDVIPRLNNKLASNSINDEIKEIKEIKEPSLCPACSTNIQSVGAKLYCVNESCSARNLQKITNYLDVLGIMGLGEKLVESLMDLGRLNSFVDLYKLDIESFLDIKGQGEKNAVKIIKEIKSKSQDIELAKFIAALGIPFCALGKAELIADKYPDIHQILALSKDQLLNVPGIGDVVAESVFNGLQDNAVLIADLLEYYVTLKAAPKTGKLTGQSFCFTGVRDKLAEQTIKDMGGKIDNSVTKTTKFLVVKDINTTSEKATKARANGTELISLEKLWEIIK